MDYYNRVLKRVEKGHITKLLGSINRFMVDRDLIIETKVHFKGFEIPLTDAEIDIIVSKTINLYKDHQDELKEETLKEL